MTYKNIFAQSCKYKCILERWKREMAEAFPQAEWSSTAKQYGQRVIKYLECSISLKLVTHYLFKVIWNLNVWDNHNLRTILTWQMPDFVAVSVSNQSKEKLTKLFSTINPFFQGRWNICSMRSHSVSLWRHHTSVCPTPVIVCTRKPIFSSLSSTRRGGSSTWYSELNKHKHNVILLSTDVGFLCLLVNIESRMLLIVLVLVHFLPHLGSFPSSIWIRLPMTTLPWSVFHQLEWFILNLQSSSLPQPHWRFFPLHVT